MIFSVGTEIKCVKKVVVVIGHEIGSTGDIILEVKKILLIFTDSPYLLAPAWAR